MSQEPTHVSRDQSIMVVGTAHINAREYDGIHDLNAFSVAAAVGMLAKVSLDRRVVLLAATRVRRVAEILEQMEQGDATQVVIHMDPELFEQVAQTLPDPRASDLRSALAADSAIRRFAAEHRAIVGAPVAAAVLEVVEGDIGFSRRYENGAVYGSHDGSVGFLDEAFLAAYGQLLQWFLPRGLPKSITSFSGRVGRFVDADSGAFYLSELGSAFLSESEHQHYQEHGGAAVFGLPTESFGLNWQDFEGGSFLETETGIHDTRRAIYERYKLDRATLGFVTGPEETLASGATVQRFEHGSVYLSQHGAFMVSGAIGASFDLHGATDGELGFPMSDAHHTLDGLVQSFEGGAIVTYDQGAFVVPLVIWDVAEGLGAPTSQPLALKTEPDRIQFFEHGLVTVVDGEAKAWWPAE